MCGVEANDASNFFANTWTQLQAPTILPIGHCIIIFMIYLCIYNPSKKCKHSQLGNWVVIIILLILQLNFLELITFNTWISSYLSRKNTRRKLTLYIRNGSMITWNGCQWRIIVQFDLLYFIYKITALLKHIVSTCNGKTSYRA